MKESPHCGLDQALVPRARFRSFFLIQYVQPRRDFYPRCDFYPRRDFYPRCGFYPSMYSFFNPSLIAETWLLSLFSDWLLAVISKCAMR